MSTQSVPKSAAPPSAAVTGPSGKQWIILAIAIAVGLAIVALPTPHGLSRIAQLVLGITAFTAIVWASQVINTGIASVLMMGLLLLAGVKVPLVLSGFGGGAFWVLLTVLFYGFAMKKTGLAERISYYILSLFPGSYRGILTAFFVIGFILALGIPSMTVRTAIMVPVAWALVQSLGLEKRSRGSGAHHSHDGRDGRSPRRRLSLRFVVGTGRRRFLRSQTSAADLAGLCAGNHVSHAAALHSDPDY